MRRPGFAHCHYDAATRTVKVIRMSNVPNKKSPTGIHGGKPHGEMLTDIYEECFKYATNMGITVIVKESAFAKFNRETAAINKAHGVVDYVLWHYRGIVPEELTAMAIKKDVAGTGRATKEDVDASLEQFVGKLSYSCDDESDAVACAIAWLIENGYIDSPYITEEEANL